MKKYLLLAILFLGSAIVCSAETSEKAKDLKPVQKMKVQKKEPVTPQVAAEKSPAPVAAEAKAPAAPVDDRLAALRQRMANNASLKDSDQAALAGAMAAHFAAGADLRAPENEKAMLFFEQVTNDPNMKLEEKLASIKKYETTAATAVKPAETTEIAKPVKTAVEAPVKAAAKVEEAKAPEKKEKKSGGFSFFKK